MKKSILLLLSIFALQFCSFAQTKKIANASHSGAKQEMRIDGEGNFGWYPNPIEEANMHHYADSIRKVDSIKNAIRKTDSVKKADSMKKAKSIPPHKTPQKKKSKGLHAAADFGMSTKSAMVSRQ